MLILYVHCIQVDAVIVCTGHKRSLLKAMGYKIQSSFHAEINSKAQLKLILGFCSLS